MTAPPGGFPPAGLDRGSSGALPGGGMMYPGLVQTESLVPLWYSLEIDAAEFAELSRLHADALARVQALTPAHWASTHAFLEAAAEFPLNAEHTRTLWQHVQNGRDALFTIQLELGQRVREVLGEARWGELQKRWRQMALTPPPVQAAAPPAAPPAPRYWEQPGAGGPPPGPGELRRPPAGMGRGPGTPPRAPGTPGTNPGSMGGGFEFYFDEDGKPPPPPAKWQ